MALKKGMDEDPDISLMFQCPFKEGLTQDKVQVDISSKYNRRVLPSYEQKIEEIWGERCLENQWLFNGAKFRIHSMSQENGILTFCLGLTDYKDYIGTNWSKDSSFLQQQGLEDFGDSQAYLAEPLGVGAMLQTEDGYFVFLRRSQQVAEAAGQVDIPGGHPEPKAVVKNIPEEAIRVEHLSRELVVQELFSSILGEIRDEVNIPEACLSRPVLLGVAQNNRSAGRPSAEFYVRCKLTVEEVRQNYLIGGPEAHESTSIVFVKAEDVILTEEWLWKQLCPSAKGGVKLYSLVRPQLD
ncbi:uridine diphosphate glucose pyrophosphatase NUDT22 [Callorhinchus milii]|uniref:Nucleoside diphosphate-linked moiety X motif 22-like protein n=1 Tax=Callorhinchus milii TaxID=7868 RepID=V9KVY2_CALMI|nr:uridine diphosphate glucose pyrophosphatase NUDT22 [Callorhinchus milii]|eukprot:gi/632987786/ref/XP_007882748.1/ PREDICTED: nucleoside diphosphate-linked moiety X motif 22 [Callorhinchus milii]